MIETYRKLIELLDHRERRLALVLLLMILGMAAIESTRIASIFPFVAVLAKPDIVTSNAYFAAIYRQFGFASPNAFLLMLGLALLITVILSQAFAALTTWATLRFSATRSFNLSRRLFEGYLSRPYEWFLARHSADLSKAALSEVEQVITGALMPAMQLLIQGLTAIAIFCLLFLADPFLAVVISALLAGLYLGVLHMTRRYVRREGEARRIANRDRFRIANEAFGGIKDVKILGLEEAFARRFDNPSLRFALSRAAISAVGQLPQYALQAIAFGTILLIVAYQVWVRGDLTQALPFIALYALAGARLMPALSGVYQSLTALSYSRPALDALHTDLMEERAYRTSSDSVEGRTALGLHTRLDLTNITYAYPTASADALRGVTLTIPARSAIGIVGSTGAGKTTLVDLILGLLEPRSGELKVDGTPITTANRRAWQRSVGYVPQSIFLMDDSVAANIAFGVPPKNIDMAAVERAARIANLNEFVVTELANGYDTLIGERGVRLSGGQRQRVGIARALYRDPDLLIMDEGTSALDNVTERAVMDAVNNLAQVKTVILIAHRLSTVRRCDTIFVLERGCLVGSGRYEELAVTNEHFREMVESTLG